MRTLHIEDHGQDFLEWDIDDSGTVIDCRPFQGSVWRGTRVMKYQEGEEPLILPPGYLCPMELKYKISRVEECEQ